MFLPIGSVVKMPTWDTEKLLDGVTFCMAHPLYHPQSINKSEFLKRWKTKENNLMRCHTA